MLHVEEDVMIMMRWWVMEFEQKWLFDYFLGIRRAPKNLRVIACKFGGCVDTTNSYNLYLQIYLQIVQNFLQIWICVDTLLSLVLVRTGRVLVWLVGSAYLPLSVALSAAFCNLDTANLDTANLDNNMLI